MARQRKPTNLWKTLERYQDAIVAEPEACKGKWAETFLLGAREVRLDLGCGKGAFLAKAAAANPDVLFVGIDVSDTCVAHAAEKAVEQGLPNVQTVIADADRIAEFFAPGELSCIYLNFNSPFPKAKHAWRRLAYADRLMTYRELVGPEGTVDLRTDNSVYWAYALTQFRIAGYEILGQTEDLHNHPFPGYELHRSEYDEKLVAKGAQVYALRARPGKAPSEAPSQEGIAQSLVDYLPEDLESLDHIPYGMEDTVENFLNRKRNAEKKARRQAQGEPAIRSVAVMGAGAVGSYFLWGLADTLGDKLYTVATGARADRLREQGIFVNGERLSLQVVSPEEAHNVDLLIVATKFGALEESLPDIKAVVGPNTLVLSVLNGVSSEDIIARAVGRKHVMPAFIKIASERDGNGIRFVPERTPGIFYGEVSGKMRTARMWALKQLFGHSKVGFNPCKDIMVQQWTKYALNVSHNLPQAILGVGVGAYEDSAHMKALQQALAQEVVAVAAAKGIDIADPVAHLYTAAATKAARFSTLQDLDAGRHTEVDLFAGDMVKMGAELGVPVPFCEFCLHAIHVLEEKNDGLFNYE